MAKEIGVRRISCYGDSDLVVQQASGNWDALDANMAAYRFHVQKISGFFDGCEFNHIRRTENESADMLSKIGSYRQAIPPGVSLEHLHRPSIKPSPESDSIFIPGNPESGVIPMDVDVGSRPQNPGTAPQDPGTPMDVACVSSDSRTELENWKAAWRNSGILWDDSGTRQPNSDMVMSVEAMEIDEAVLGVRLVPVWAQPITSYMVDGSFPSDEVSARQIQRRSKAFTIINSELYKRSATTVL